MRSLSWVVSAAMPMQSISTCRDQGFYRDLGGEVAGDVAAPGGVAGDGQAAELFAVEQPRDALVGVADGDQQGVGGLDPPGARTEVFDLEVGGEVPVQPVGGSLPRER